MQFKTFKRTLLASSALAMFAGAGQAQAGDLYLSVFGGANWQADSSAVATSGGTQSASQNIDPDTGFALGGAIGANLSNWLKGLRVEVEASYRRNDLGGNWTTNTGGSSGTVDGNMSTFAVMANVWYDIDFGWKIRPYLGGGAGWGQAEADGAFLTSTGSFSTFNMEESGFAWQVGAGFNYEAAPGVDVGFGYRYFNGEDFPSFYNSGGCGVSPVEVALAACGAELENENHAVMVNLNIDIN